MKTLTVKKKEISIKDPTRLLIEDEVAPEDIEIVIVDASTISNIEELNFYLQYVNKLGQYGIEVLDKDYTDGVLTLSWRPSEKFTKESGKVEIQVFGYVLDDDKIINRWSTIKTSLTLPENIQKPEITLIDKRSRARLTQVINTLNS